MNTAAQTSLPFRPPYLVLCLAGLLLLSGANAASQNRKSQRLPPALPAASNKSASPSPAPTVNPESAAALSQISAGLDEVNESLQKMRSQLADVADLNKIDIELESSSNDLESRRHKADEIINSSPTPAELQDLNQDWHNRRLRPSSLKDILASSAEQLAEDTRVLNAQQAKWEETLSQIQNDPSLQELAGRVRQSLTDIQNTRELVEDQLKFTVTLQNRLSQQEELVTEQITRIDNALAQLRRGLFQQDSVPLWAAGTRQDISVTTGIGVRKYYAGDLNRVREFLREKRPALLTAVAVFLVVVAANFKVRKKTSALIENGVIDAGHVHLITRPFSLGLLLAFLVIFPLLPMAPTPVRGILSLLFVIPILRLMVPLITPGYRPLLYATLAIALLFQLCKLMPASLTFKRFVLALIMVIAVLLADWLLRRARIEEGRRPSALFRIYMGSVLALMLASLVANVAGYFALSLLLGDGALLSSCFAIILYTAQRIVSDVGAAMLRTRSAQKLAVVREYRPRITNGLRTLLLFVALVSWVLGTLNLFTVRDRVLNEIGGALAEPIQMGRVTFTMGDVLTFLLIFVIGIVCANVVRVLLREDILKRLPLQHGIPYALSTVTYYLLLVAIFLVALSGSGVELSKFAILTGAFGVGVGFGLQNVINNFASGLILLFERPIRVHDMLEVEGHTGAVTRIGMRSTSIRTIDGAEVIFPNSSLVAGKVINWSRLSMRRRVELQVHVAYGTDPEEVLKLLKETAAAHPDVLTDPEPTAFFKAFGETAQQFTLVFWVPKFHLYNVIRTEVAVALSKALSEAGIKVPFPQHDLHVKSVDPSVHDLWETRSASASGSPVGGRPPDGKYKADS